MKIKTQKIYSSILREKEIKLFIKRIDQINQNNFGNKWFKLKYNLICAKAKGVESILTFGGAYSNHIAATAYIARQHRFTSIGIIRGDEQFPLNSTLSFAIENGMKLYYVSRSDYRLKCTDVFLQKLKSQFGNFYLIPEGGTNALAIKGTEEILDTNDTQDYICCAVGTGGTIAGIINSKHEYQKAIGFPVVNDLELLQKNIENWSTEKRWELINDYLYGGYAKVDASLVEFVNDFYLTQNIPLDIIYTGKMMMGIFDLIKQDYFSKGSSILAIHTGGLQGNKGMNERFSYNLPVN
jgi:1-aminocyclopropane-1-carboxylate deaminase